MQSMVILIRRLKLLAVQYDDLTEGVMSAKKEKHLIPINRQKEYYKLVPGFNGLGFCFGLVRIGGQDNEQI